jgi:hypothetical protein
MSPRLLTLFMILGKKLRNFGSQCPVRINNMPFVAIKMGRRSRGRGNSRRPIFIATLRAVASWPFFCGVHSLRINSDMLVASASAARTALKNNQLVRQLPRESHAIYGTGH